MQELTEPQISLISHSLGIDYYNAVVSHNIKDKVLPEKFYRNYYNYGQVDSNEGFTEDMKALLHLGLIKKFERLKSKCFTVTPYGISEFTKIFTTNVINKHVPLKKSQQKYVDFLNADSGLTFAEFNGIWVPKKERNSKGEIRFLSTKYAGVCGDFCLTKAEAKDTYKAALSKYKEQNKKPIDYLIINQ